MSSPISFKGMSDAVKSNSNFVQTTITANNQPGQAIDMQLPSLASKESPNDLAEYINRTVEKVGCYIYIIRDDGRITNVTNRFYLTAMSISLKERVQLLELFDASSVSFFDEAVRVYSFSGAAVDFASQDSEERYRYFHQSGLMTLYNDYMRGSKLVQNNSIAVIRIYNHTIYGYPLNLNTQYDGTVDKLAQFNMQWVVAEHRLDNPLYISADELKYLTESYKGSRKYLESVNLMLEAIIHLDDMSQWKDISNAAALAIDVIGLNKVSSIPGSALVALVNEIRLPFRDKLLIEFNRLRDVVQGLMYTNSNRIPVFMSPILKEHFPDDSIWQEIPQQIDKTFILSVSSRSAEILEAWDKVQLFLANLCILRHRLEILKAENLL